MDGFTHAIVAYLAGRGARLSKNDRFAVIVGGVAPDLDVIFFIIPILFPQLYLLSHRGLFHSFIAMWMMIGLGLLLVTRGPVKKLIKRFMKYDVEMQISPRTFALAYLGGTLHLILDYITTDGPALFAPLTTAKYSLQLFQYSDILLTVIALSILLLSTRVPWQKMRPVFMVFVILILAFASIRCAMRANVHGPGNEIYPTNSMNEWIVIERQGASIHAVIYDSLSGSVVIEKSYTDVRSNASLASLLSKTDALAEIQWLLWGNAVVSVSAERDEANKTWHVHYTDVLNSMAYARASWQYFWFGSDFTTTVDVKD